MKIATNPIGSIATKIGMKASRNFSITTKAACFRFTQQSFYTIFASSINQTFPHETIYLALPSFALCSCSCCLLHIFRAAEKTVDDFRAAAAQSERRSDHSAIGNKRPEAVEAR